MGDMPVQDDSVELTVPSVSNSDERNALTQEEKQVGKSLQKFATLSREELSQINSREGLLQMLSRKNVDVRKALLNDFQLEIGQLEHIVIRFLL